MRIILFIIITIDIFVIVAIIIAFIIVVITITSIEIFVTVALFIIVITFLLLLLLPRVLAVLSVLAPYQWTTFSGCTTKYQTGHLLILYNFIYKWNG